MKLKFTPAKVGNNWVVFPGKPMENWTNVMPQKGGIAFAAESDPFNIDLRIPGCKMEDECTLYQELDSPEEGTFVLGFSADWWWELYINGELCLSTMKDGNGFSQVRSDDHPFTVHYRKGKNLFAARLVRGAADWLVSCAGSSLAPIVAKVMAGPWLCNPDAGSMGIRFLTGSDIAAGVEYREKGSDEWLMRWHSEFGQMIRSDAHYVELNGLRAGGEYEYRIIMKHPAEATGIVRDGSVHGFHVPDSVCSKVSFLYTADLQFGPEQQKTYTDILLEAADYKTVDFFALGGDISEFQNIRTDLVDGMIQNLVQYGASEKPIVFIRGNHELRGREAWVFRDFFALPNGRTYGIFRFGSTAFLVLDCWEDKPATSNTSYTAYNVDREFLQEERAYLNEALKHPAWAGAKRRIVLAHSATYSNFDDCLWMPFRMQKMTDPWFHGKNPLYKLDLWLAGHSHIHERSVPGTDILAAPVEPPKPHRTGENDIYPVLTVGGPTKKSPVQASVYRVDVEADKITVKAFDQTGKLIDHVVYGEDGTNQELMEIPHFHVPASDKTDRYYGPDDPL